MRARVVAPLVAAVLGIGAGVATALAMADDNSKPSDPLNLGIRLENQACTEDSLLVVGYGDNRAGVTSAVANSGKEGLHYLRTAASCDTLLGPEARPAPAYVVYRGPFPSRSDPCRIRMSGQEPGSFVTVLREGNSQLVKCPCEIPSNEAPRLFLHMTADASETLWIRALQNMFHDDDPQGFPLPISGDYDQRTSDRVAAYQDRAPGRVTARGEVDAPTWRILTDRLCRNYNY